MFTFKPFVDQFAALLDATGTRLVLRTANM